MADTSASTAVRTSESTEIEDLRRRSWALSAYAEGTSALIHARAPSEFYSSVCEAVVTREPFIAAGVMLLDADLRLSVVAKAGPAAAYFDDLRLSARADHPSGMGPGGHAARSGEPTYMRDSLTDPRFADWRGSAARFGIRSTVSVPFSRDGKVLGLLSVYANLPDAFGPEEVGIFSKLGDEVAFALGLEEDRRRLEAEREARQSSERRYRLLFDHFASGIIFTDPEGVFIDVSPTFCRMLGRSAEDLLGLTADDILAEEGRAAFDQAREAFRASGEPSSLRRCLLTRADGTVFPVDLSVTMLPDKTRLSIVTDLSQVIEAEAAREAVETRYQSLFQHASEGLVVGDADGVYLDANPAFCAMVQMTREEVIGKSAVDILAPEEWPLLAGTRETFKTTGSYTTPRRWTFRRKDGTTFPAEFSVSRLPDGARLSVVRDVSEVVAAETALAASEARYRGLFDQGPAAVVVVSAEGFYVDINPAGCAMLGVDRDAFVGQAVDAILDPDEQLMVSQAAERIRTEGVFRGHWRLRRFDGGYVSTEVVSTLLPDGNFVSVMIDITAREAAQAAQLNSEARYASLFDFAPVGIVLFRDDLFLDINPAGVALLGYPREAFIGQRLSLVLSEEDLKNVPRDLEDLYRTGSAHRVLRLRRADGRQVPVDIVSTLLPDGAGVSLLTDLTDRERAEAAERAAEETVREARAHLERLGRTAALGEVMTVLAHEVNQPLAAISANGEAARRWLARDPPNLSEAGEALGAIRRDVARAGEVIRRTRAVLQGRPSERVAFDLNAAVSEAARLMRTEQRRAGVATILDLAEDLPPVRGDRIQVQQVVVNLALNAIQAMAELGEPPRLLTLSVARRGEVAEVCVTDTGPGLPPGDVDQIFDQFFTTKAEGTGVGLAIARTIVTAHGGEIRAEPATPRGARFIFTLPLATSDGDAA